MSPDAHRFPRDIPMTLNYHAAMDDDPPYQYALQDPPMGKKRSNVTPEAHVVVINDPRRCEAELTLDTTGFEFLTWRSRKRDCDDEVRIKAGYYPEVETLLKAVTGVERVFVFVPINRRSTENERGKAGANRERRRTYDATVERLRDHLPEDADPVARDLVSVRIVMPHREGQTFGVRYHPGHCWYHLSSQTPDEVVLVDARARLAVHSAFLDSTSPVDTPHRQSIEVRALVFGAGGRGSGRFRK
ncbi:hypothetical protein BC628DRAFT_1409580 [Trametes gibbosa]|nr:hypothetical protein BC628DRAFT_1409580 [Trametes gibbosa]